jgi:hypothetical protein
MAVRAWDAGAQNVALGIMYLLLFVFMISLGITQSNWRWNFQTIFGLVFFGGVLYTWILGFIYRFKQRVRTS